MQLHPLIIAYGLLICAAFVDNIRGPLFPHMTRSLDISYAVVGDYVTAFYTAASLGTLSLAFFYQRHSLYRGVVFACGLLILGCISIQFSQDAVSLIISALLLGAGVSAIGTTTNLIVLAGTPSESAARSLAGLHLMYGLGSVIAPMTAAYSISYELTWSVAFLFVIPLLCFLMVSSRKLISLRLTTSEKPPSLVWPNRSEWLVIFTFSAYVLGEVLTSAWLVTYLVEAKGFTDEVASRYASGFFLTLMCSRGFCLLLPNHFRWHFGLSLVSIIFGFIFLLLGHTGWFVCFSLSGIVGPYFPVFLAKTKFLFPGSWSRLTIWIIVTMQALLAITNSFMGRLVSEIGAAQAFYAPVIMYGLAILAMSLLWKSHSTSS